MSQACQMRCAEGQTFLRDSWLLIGAFWRSLALCSTLAALEQAPTLATKSTKASVKDLKLEKHSRIPSSHLLCKAPPARTKCAREQLCRCGVFARVSSASHFAFRTTTHQHSTWTKDANARRFSSSGKRGALKQRNDRHAAFFDQLPALLCHFGSPGGSQAADADGAGDSPDPAGNAVELCCT